MKWTGGKIGERERVEWAEGRIGEREIEVGWRED